MIKLNGRIMPKRLFGRIRIDYGPYNGTLQSKVVEPSTEDQNVVADEGYNALSLVLVKAATLQEKTVTPSSQEQTVVPDVGVYGLSKVIVEPQGNHGLLEEITVSPKQEEQVFTPSEGYYGIDVVNVEAALLEDVTVYPDYAAQTIRPSEGYYGIGSITVEAMDDPESGGGSGDDIGAAEDTTFGDEYTEETETGRLDYSCGTDDSPNYIPEIPGEGYKVLFSKKRTAGSSRLRYYMNGVTYDIKSDGNISAYVAWGYVGDATVWHLNICSDTNDIIYQKAETATAWASYGRPSAYGDKGYLMILSYGTISGIVDSSRISVQGLAKFFIGDFSDDDSFKTAAEEVANFGDEDKTGGDQMIAFVSGTQITYDGSSINNIDNSPMTIYEIYTSEDSEWSYLSTTDGTDYPAGGYTLVWTSDDLLDMTGENVTEEASGDPVPEISGGVATNPAERDDLYTVAGDTMNTLVSAAQKVTGSHDLLTPDEAASALEDYYSQPKAEELKF